MERSAHQRGCVSTITIMNHLGASTQTSTRHAQGDINNNKIHFGPPFAHTPLFNSCPPNDKRRLLAWPTLYCHSRPLHFCMQMAEYWVQRLKQQDLSTESKRAVTTQQNNITLHNITSPSVQGKYPWRQLLVSHI